VAALSSPSLPSSPLPAATTPNGKDDALAAPLPCARPSGRVVGGGKSGALRAAAAAPCGARADDLEIGRD
jgi:hypothetical protein